MNKDIFAHYPIDSNGLIFEKLTRLQFSNKTVLPRDMLFFLEKGLVRKCFTDPEQESDISVDFYFTGDIFTAKADKEAEQQFSYRPVGKGTLWYMKMDEVRKMFYESQLCSTTQKVFLEEQLREKAIREIQLLRRSPAELYKYLLTDKPRFIQYVPLKYLASYIGITPQALSRIRKRIS